MSFLKSKSFGFDSFERFSREEKKFKSFQKFRLPWIYNQEPL